MARNKMDMKFKNIRLTFRRDRRFPVSIQSRARKVVTGVSEKVVYISLSDSETRSLFNFLGDYFMPEGVPDGA